jgi:Zn-dependent protease/CBS domain-containing protein
LILAFLITWTLGVGHFPSHLPGLTPATYWWMGLLGALGLFGSIIVHELGHSVVARRYGIPMKGITLFIFGGVAEMTDEPPSAKSEFMMAIAGPIVSFIVSAVCALLFWVSTAAGWPIPFSGVLEYLASINFLLAVFNMIPAFPLDGGRVLRAALWGWKKDLPSATRISSTLGSAFGILLMVLGMLSLFGGNIIGGIWWFVLGIFLRSASRSSYQLVLLRQLLEGEPVQNFMCKDPVTVPSSATVRQLVEDYIYRHHHKFFPVVDNGELEGCITLNRVKEVPPKDWERRTVRELLFPCNETNTIPVNSDTMKALSMMHNTGASRMMVVDNGRLVGVLALKDLISFLALKLEIEGKNPSASAIRPITEPRSPSPPGKASMAR